MIKVSLVINVFLTSKFSSEFFLQKQSSGESKQAVRSSIKPKTNQPSKKNGCRVAFEPMSFLCVTPFPEVEKLTDRGQPVMTVAN